MLQWTLRIGLFTAHLAWRTWSEEKWWGGGMGRMQLIIASYIKEGSHLASSALVLWSALWTTHLLSPRLLFCFPSCSPQIFFFICMSANLLNATIESDSILLSSSKIFWFIWSLNLFYYCTCDDGISFIVKSTWENFIAVAF